MKQIDPKTAAKVWDRVQNTVVPTPDAQAVLNLIAEEMLDAAAYARLSKKLPPPQAAIARQISQQEQSHISCLKGIYTLITGRKAIVPPQKVTDDPPDIVLRRCYGREMRCLAQYEARQNDVQYGYIFRKLALQEQEHCRQILELLGMLAK